MKQQKTKILFISHTSYLGGAEMVLWRFLSQVTMFDPFVLLPDGPLYEELEKSGLKVIKSKYLTKLNKELNHFWIWRFIIQFVSSLFEITKQIRTLKPEIVQSNNVYTTVYCIIPCLLSRTPLIWHMHDFASSNKGLRVLVRFIVLFAKKVIAVSEAVRDDLIKIGVSDNLIVTIYNSISLENLDDNNSNIHLIIQAFKEKFDFIVGMAGSLEERKGFLECVRALSIIRNKNTKKIGLVIIGEAKGTSQKQYEAELNKEIEKHGLTEQILFLGRINEIKSFFQEIDVFIHYPKYPDPLPTVILEAIAFNCPVVVSDNGGNPEIVQNGRWGKLIKVNDPEDLANTLLNYTFSPLSPESTREFFQFFSHQQKELLHLNLYDQLIP